MKQKLIHIEAGVARNPQVRLQAPVNFSLEAGQHLAIAGPNGGGKSLLVDMMMAKYPLREGKITFDFSPSLTHTVYD
ncbi:MAG: ABC transporter ATP-binding protein, partial [Bacteroides sp.]|nr:ABC transporter ATP-binding protein [Bacteroides sp.]